MNDWLNPLPQPETVWNRFLELNRVPRPSKQESAAIEHLRNWAAQLRLEARSDAVGNLVVHVPATPGRSGPTVILQCHVDIVAVNDPDAGPEADSAQGRIPIVRGDLDPSNDKKLVANSKGDWVNAPLTTLGADNGIGVAMMMALAESAERPVPLQLLFTIDEEAGMTGAGGMDPVALGLTGTMLINIDTEDDTEVTIGAAGGRDVELTWQGECQPLSSPGRFRLAIKNLKGGHSGVEINQGRANANRLLARGLKAISQSVSGLQLITFKGGSRRNAIPDASEATLAMAPDSEPLARSSLAALAKGLNELYGGRDNRIELDFQPLAADHSRAQSSSTTSGLSNASTVGFIDLLLAIPTGICEMTPEIPTLVESSCNMAIIQLDSSGRAQIICSVRGTTASALGDISDTLMAIARMSSSSTKISDGYPGWKPCLSSKLLAVVIAEYEKLFREKPKVHAVHAGLECGLLLEKMPELEAVSIGPTIKGNHAVGERVQISSVEKSYRMIQAILASLSRP